MFVQPFAEGSGRRWAFTLVEMLVVIVVIAILAALLLPALLGAKRRANIAKCTSQLRQFMHGMEMYKNNYENRFAPWMSSLYPAYVNAEAIFICPADTTRGQEGGKPEWFTTSGDPGQFTETDDNGKGTARTEIAAMRNDAIEANSYMYEFGAMECSWWDSSKTWADTDGDGFVSWREAKETERTGQFGATSFNDEEAYAGHVPMIRCFWHVARTKALIGDEMVLNIACENTNVYECQMWGDGWKAAAP
jgi:prepilin-type N-terminal cleavage/methylation domain-containing protein